MIKGLKTKPLSVLRGFIADARYESLYFIDTGQARIQGQDSQRTFRSLTILLIKLSYGKGRQAPLTV